MVTVVRRGRHDDRRLDLIAQLGERPREQLLGLHEVIAARDRERRLREPQLEASSGARLDELGSAPGVIGGPAEAAGVVDDLSSGVSQRKQRSGRPDRLVVGMG